MCALTTGLGVQYSPSIITNITKNKNAARLTHASASKLIIGQRLPPSFVLRAADLRPVEIQDLCPSDTRFKVFVFVGDIFAPCQRERLKRFADHVVSETSVLKHFGDKAFEIMCVIKGPKETSNYMEVPSVLRSHWTKYVLFVS